MKKILIPAILIFILFISYGLFEYMSIDRSGKLTLDGILFKGEEYKHSKFVFTKVGKQIGKADSWKIHEIPEDKNHNFLEVSSFLDNFYVVKSSYNIPTEGKINVVYIDRERYIDTDIKEAVNYLLNSELLENFTIETDNIYYYLKDVYIGYEDCPVGTEYVGMIGYVNDKFVYIKPTERKYKDTGSPEKQLYSCYIISNQYKKVFEKYPYYTHHNTKIVGE